MKSEGVRGDAKCCLCDKCCDEDADDGRTLVEGHIVPGDVLKCLWDWKAKSNRENMGGAKPNYIFMTVKGKGQSVTSQCCKIKKWCNKCEDRFQHLDVSASQFWQEMSKNWKEKRKIIKFYKNEQRHVDIRKAVLFSMMVRGMYLSLGWSKLHDNLLCTFKKSAKG